MLYKQKAIFNKITRNEMVIEMIIENVVKRELLKGEGHNYVRV